MAKTELLWGFWPSLENFLNFWVRPRKLHPGRTELDRPPSQACNFFKNAYITTIPTSKWRPRPIHSEPGWFWTVVTAQTLDICNFPIFFIFIFIFDVLTQNLFFQKNPDFEAKNSKNHDFSNFPEKPTENPSELIFYIFHTPSRSRDWI